MSLPPSPPELGPLDRQNVVALEEAPASPLRRILLETLETIVLALLLFLAINFVSARVRVEFNSMLPNFENGDYVIVNRLAYRWNEPQRGDVVVFPYPNNVEEDYIKRVIGVPGDRVAIYAGVLYINGQPVEEPYLSQPTREDLAERVVPPGHVFVMGDNRNASSDSRSWGPLAIENIVGKAVFRYFPFDVIGIIEHPVLGQN
ncbi:MAG: signal peptidase I [Anaerolineales bacterium]|nr:signal peptidase I [Anaerolineales bacterium]